VTIVLMIALSLGMTETTALGDPTAELDSLPPSGWSEAGKVSADHMFR
jgi:hypothetical protein